MAEMADRQVNIRCFPRVDLDEIEAADAAILPVFAGERPLPSLAGLVDWRLYGQLSRLLLRGQLTGAPGESWILPSQGLLPFEKILLYGMGPREALTQHTCREAIFEMAKALGGVRAQRQVWPLWDMGAGLLDPVEVAELTLSLSVSILGEGGILEVVGGGAWCQALRDALQQVTGHSSDGVRITLMR